MPGMDGDWVWTWGPADPALDGLTPKRVDAATIRAAVNRAGLREAIVRITSGKNTTYVRTAPGRAQDVARVLAELWSDSQTRVNPQDTLNTVYVSRHGWFRTLPVATPPLRVVDATVTRRPLRALAAERDAVDLTTTRPEQLVRYERAHVALLVDQRGRTLRNLSTHQFLSLAGPWLAKLGVNAETWVRTAFAGCSECACGPGFIGRGPTGRPRVLVLAVEQIGAPWTVAT
jgi:hypothetical protein